MTFLHKLAKRLAQSPARPVIGLAALFACELPTRPPVPSGNQASRLAVSPKLLTLQQNQAVDFTAVAFTSTGDTADVAVSWTVTSGSITDTSTNNGKHYGRYRAGSDTGKVKVVAKGNLGGPSDTAVVTVTLAPVAVVTVSPATASVAAGQTVQLTATPKDVDGNPLSGRVVTWATNNAAVATVSGTGLVTGGTAGTATLTAGSEGKTGTATITVTNVPVASVTVTPASAGVTVAQTVQLTATPTDASGNPLAGRVVTWASNATGVATVSGSGLVTGVAAGSATITATSEARSGTAAVTVTAVPPPPAPPGTVTNLTVAGVTESSVTLSFTELTDGAGQPASYEIRYMAGTISWAAASSVTQGSCATPVAGSAIGATRTCTVLGLASSTGYQVQLVAFRGTLNVDAVFGALSNVASGTTAASTAPVASVTVSPATASLGVGGTQQLTATLRDASGNVLTGRAVTWTSSDVLIGTVSGTGLVTALAVGAATVTAMSEGQNGTAAITVTAPSPPPPGGSWPNEPAGWTLVDDYDMHALNDGGWTNVYPSDITVGKIGVVNDASAPLSPSAVWQFFYAAGYTGGVAPATVDYPIISAPTGLYVGFWWKPSNPWQGHSSKVNKLMFIYVGGAGSMSNLTIQLYGAGSGPFNTRMVTEGFGPGGLFENVGSTSPLALGVWHRIEILMNTPSGALKWWVDGVLVGSYTGIGYPSGGFWNLEFSPTWGGLGDTKSENDYFRFDHLHASRP